jgi:bla regulator protein BlaR1
MGMVRFALVVLFAFVWAAEPSSSAQTTPAAAGAAKDAAAAGRTATFDAATIKPVQPNSPPTRGWAGTQVKRDGIEMAWVTLAQIIQQAYGPENFPLQDQITGVPAWAATQRFDIVGKMSAEDVDELKKLDNASQARRREEMLQALLADRFKLAVHRGTKQAPIYELVAKGATKMRDAATDTTPPALGKKDDGTPKTGIRWLKDTSIVQAYSMGSLAQFLSSPVTHVGRPVVDKTGLTGTYNFNLNWSVYSAEGALVNSAAVTSEDAPSIFTALGEIGLKLQPATGTLETIAIDHVERPTEN